MNAPIAPADFSPSFSPALPQDAPADFGTTPDGQRPTRILPHQMPEALAPFPEARILSLDCFDTLLWRDCHAPHDVFTALPGLSPLMRGRAEQMARRASTLAGRGQDVTIAEIYAELMPNAPPAQRQAAIRAELDAEARHCFAFSPTVELMRRAKAAGLTIIIVSDTYLDAAQLRELIGRAAGEDVAGLIDKVFCSSKYRKFKGQGLYGDVLRELKVPPATILHIGDNEGADVKGVAPFGVTTLHLKQFHAEIQQQLRLESCIGAMIHAQHQGTMTAPQPHRAAIATHSPQLGDAAQHFGNAVLGPVLTGFDRWLEGEAQALQAAHGGKVHWLFLMRDGWLPMRVHQARVGDDTAGSAIEISRFTSTGASFVSAPTFDAYIENNLGIMPDILARQLLLSEGEISRLVEGKPPLEGTRALQAHMRKGQNRRAVQKAARAMAEGILAHIRAATAVEKGDTLMLVDLGYNGSVQSSVQDLLTRGLGAHVAGRYLVLRETEMTGHDKKGYFGAQHYDIRALNAMSSNVAVLEQLCTTPTGSVIGYTPEGQPIRRSNDIKQRQSAIREAVQEGCLLHARTDGTHIQRPQSPGDATEMLRRANAATLTRLMFLPLAYELDVLRNFEHDVNLGTDETLALFDPAIAERGLRQQGMFYQKGVRRMYLPAELASQSLATRLTHFAASRYALELNVADFAGSNGVMVPVVYTNGQEVMPAQFNAMPTHDGFYAVCIPIGDCRYTAAIQLGAVFEWVEAYSVSAMPAAEYLNNRHDTHEREIMLEPLFDGVERPAPNLWHLQKPTAFALVNPPARVDDTPMLLVVVFRPVVWRDNGAAQTGTS
ncbi:MAG TPA: HAD family hydrolase [Novosphingobium sp.]|nr:HAD family hydrolase [Novosphingobium sp.]